MVSMVFYGEPRSALHAHDAGPAMKVALIPLAFGALTSWLLAGPFSGLLSTATLPYHGIEAESTWKLLGEVVSLPTLLVLAVVALGLAAWWWREKLSGLTKALRGVSWAASNSFGFEAINRGIVKGTQWSAEKMRDTQTGELSWNVFGIVSGLIILLVIFLVVGA
jgi:NADH-quinone oxidoreductase subunit L